MVKPNADLFPDMNDGVLAEEDISVPVGQGLCLAGHIHKLGLVLGCGRLEALETIPDVHQVVLVCAHHEQGQLEGLELTEVIFPVLAAEGVSVCDVREALEHTHGGGLKGDVEEAGKDAHLRGARSIDADGNKRAQRAVNNEPQEAEDLADLSCGEQQIPSQGRQVGTDKLVSLHEVLEENILILSEAVYSCNLTVVRSRLSAWGGGGGERVWWWWGD